MKITPDSVIRSAAVSFGWAASSVPKPNSTSMPSAFFRKLSFKAEQN